MRQMSITIKKIMGADDLELSDGSFHIQTIFLNEGHWKNEGMVKNEECRRIDGAVWKEGAINRIQKAHQWIEMESIEEKGWTGEDS